MLHPPDAIATRLHLRDVGDAVMFIPETVV